VCVFVRRNCSEREQIAAELALACCVSANVQFVCQTGATASREAEAGLLLTEDRTGDAEFQGFDNHYWAPEVIKLPLHFDD
jgi:hypothetical protein